MSSTPITPATTPPRNRPTPVALLESLLTGYTLSASTAKCGLVIDIVQVESKYFAVVTALTTSG